MVSAPELSPCPPLAGGSSPGCAPASGHSPQQVQAAARSILAERQFHHGSTSWLGRLDDWLDRGVGDGLRFLFSGSGLTTAGIIVAGVLVVGAVALAARFTRRVQSDPALRVREDQVGRRPVDWRAEADRHAAAGDWRSALRCQYRALIAELASREIVEEIPGRTAREYELQVAGRAPQAADAFTQASDLFESVWYGFEACGPADLDHFAELSAQVETGLPRRFPAATAPAGAGSRS